MRRFLAKLSLICDSIHFNAVSEVRTTVFLSSRVFNAKFVPRVSSLSLCNDNAASIKLVAQAIRSALHLRSLTITRFTLSEQGFAEICDAAMNLISLDINGSCGDFDRDSETLKPAGDALVRLVRCSSNLRSLRFVSQRDAGPVVAAVAEAIAVSNLLTSLDVRRTMADVGDFSKLLRSPKCSLKHLNASRNVFGGKDSLPEFAAALTINTSLETLKLMHFGWKESESAGILAHALMPNRTLKRLILSQTRILWDSIDDFCELFRHNATLESADLSYAISAYTDASPMLQALARSNSTLTELNLSGAKLNDVDSSRSLLSLIQRHPRLRTLRLQKLAFSRDQFLSICKGLRHSKVLTALDLEEISFPCGDQLVAEFVSALVANNTLTDLNLALNQIGFKDHLTSFRMVLEQNTTLRKLDLGACGVDDTAARELLKGLKVNSSLTHLGLMCATLNQDGVSLRQFVNHMSEPETVLTDLDLRFSVTFLVDWFAARALADAVARTGRRLRLAVSFKSVHDLRRRNNVYDYYQ